MVAKMKLKLGTRIIIVIACLMLLMVSWIVVVVAKSPAARQMELIGRAAALTEDKVYVRAVPLLEEAIGIGAVHTPQAEEALKTVLRALANQPKYGKSYTGLLDTLMGRSDAPPSIFAEAAEYYLGIDKKREAYEVLRAGIDKTGDEGLVAFYEDVRYAFETNVRKTYEYASAMHGGTAQVRIDGLWGIAEGGGTLLIPCEYDKISTFSDGRAIVKKGGEISAVDRDNNRIALLHENAYDFGNYADDRIPLLFDGGWRRATGEFQLGTDVFQQFGMYSGGFAAAKSDGRWGVVDIKSNWIVPAEFDMIVCDELGRAYAQGAAFVRHGGKIWLYRDGAMTGESYDEARPFSDEGYAAVKRYGKWGFIDSNGNMAIDFRYDDALSFGQHLAAVRMGEFWGYIGLSGKMVIEPRYLEAKSFSEGSAPVLTEYGWRFITLIEFKKEVGL
jgi:hypothetical protein